MGRLLRTAGPLLAAALACAQGCGGCDDDPTGTGAGSSATGAAGPGGAGGEGAGPFRLSAPVDVVRDVEGVVHVYGETDADVFYASGYMQAADRLFQMDLQRRRALGRRAEVLGASALEQDTLIRTLDLPRWGRANADAARSETPGDYALVEAWTAGVNARIEAVLAGTAPLPLGFDVLGYSPERWEAADAFTVGKAILFSNANQLEFDLLASLLDAYVPDLFASIPAYSPLTDAFIAAPSVANSGTADSDARPRPRRDAPADARERLLAFVRKMRPHRPGASNNWAVAPAHTDTGRSLIAGDPHQPLRSPSLMWMHHMSSKAGGGTFDVAGWSFVGTPGVSLGHNDRIAWTATTNYPDVTDIYDVEVTGGQARIGDTWLPVVARQETLQIAGAEPVTISLEAVEGVGVLLPPDISPLPLVDAGRRILLQWTGFRVTHEAQAFFAFDRATTLAEFEAAVDRMELGSFNFVAADAGGITYRSRPIVPDRGSPAVHQPSFLIMDGADASAFWSGGLLPPEKMPAVLPGVPFIVSANNDPFGFTQDGDLTNDPWYFGAYFDPGTRARRIEDQLEELTTAGSVSIEDLQGLQDDTHSLVADEVLADLAAAWARVPTDDTLAEFRDRPELAALMTLLAGWDRRMERDAAAPAAFQALLHFYVRGVIADDMSFFFEPVLESSPIYAIKFALLAARDPAGTLLQEGKDLLVLRALSDASELLLERYGSVDTGYTWADAHQTRFPSESIPELDGGATATDGAEGTVNVSDGQFFVDGEPAERHTSDAGSIYRMTAGFDDDGIPRAFFNMARGASGEPASPFFDDRTSDWVENVYALLRFRRSDVDAGTIEVIRLEP